MTDIRARLADALLDMMGESADWDGVNHVVDVLLSLPGIAIVELPEPDDTGAGPQFDEFTAWWGHYPDNDPRQVARWPGYDVCTEGDEVSYGGNNHLPAEAREIAAALLAAADAAESHTQPRNGPA